MPVKKFFFLLILPVVVIAFVLFVFFGKQQITYQQQASVVTSRDGADVTLSQANQICPKVLADQLKENNQMVAVELAWSGGDANTFYRVERGLGSGVVDFTDRRVTQLGVRSFVDILPTDENIGEDYSYRIAAISGDKTRYSNTVSLHVSPCNGESSEEGESDNANSDVVAEGESVTKLTQSDPKQEVAYLGTEQSTSTLFLLLSLLNTNTTQPKPVIQTAAVSNALQLKKISSRKNRTSTGAASSPAPTDSPTSQATTKPAAPAATPSVSMPTPVSISSVPVAVPTVQAVTPQPTPTPTVSATAKQAAAPVSPSAPTTTVTPKSPLTLSVVSPVCINSRPSVILNWTSASSARTYSIERAAGKTNPTFAGELMSGLTSTQFTDQRWASDYGRTYYSYRVQAINGSQTEYSNVVAVLIPECASTTASPAPTSAQIPATPTATLTASSTFIAYNAKTNLVWSSTNATSCTLSSGQTGVRGSMATPILAKTTIYTLNCTGAGGSVAKSLQVTVADAPVTATPPTSAPTAPTPTATLTASSTSIAYNSKTNLVWGSTDTTSCTLTGGKTGTRGSMTTPSLTSTTMYTLACSGTGGVVSKSLSINVAAAPATAPTPTPTPIPTVSLSASSTALAYNAKTNLVWSSTNATSCTLSSGQTGVRGSITTPSLTQATTYTVNCTGAGGSATKNISIAVAAAPAPAPTSTPAPTPAPAPTQTGKMPSWMKWGAYVGWQDSAMSSFEAMVGKQPQMEMVFAHWGNDNFPSFDKARIADKGRTMVLFWEAVDYNRDYFSQPEYSFDSVLAGKQDAYFTKFAADAKAYGGEVILIPYSEFNGDWFPWGGTVGNNTPEKYIAAYRYLHNFFVNVPNVKFGWAPNNDAVPDTAANKFELFYPGDAYVDVVGVDGFSSTKWWGSFDSLFRDPITRLKTYKKPIYIFSMGAAEDARKPAWITDALTVQLAKYPEVVGWLWFNENKESNWLINSSQAALTAFKSLLP